MSSLFNSPWVSDICLASHFSLQAPFDYLHQVELVLKIFKTFKLEVCTLFLTLDMLRRVAVEMRSANKYQISETAKKLAGPLCMTLACKYDIRSTFSIGQIASQFDPTILLSCDLSSENLTMAEFEIFRMLTFKIKDNSIILPDLLFESLSKVFFPPLLHSLPS